MFEKTCARTQKNIKSHVFLKSEKNVKYVFSNSVGNSSVGHNLQEAREDRQCQRGSVSKRKRYTIGSGMHIRQKEMEEVCPCRHHRRQLIGKDGRAKEDDD